MMAVGSTIAEHIKGMPASPVKGDLEHLSNNQYIVMAMTTWLAV